MAIYDCFTFFNEIDLLKIRLDLLYPYVDKFVISEMNVTHRGETKEFIFEKNREQFTKWNDKIIYLKVEDPPLDEYTGDMDWILENYQRNCLIRGLTQCKPNDLIIISDLDEIPNPLVLQDLNKRRVSWFYANITAFKFCFIPIIKFFRFLSLIEPSLIKNYFIGKKNINSLLDYTPISLQHNYYNYFMNMKNTRIKWVGSVISKYKRMYMPNEMRRQNYKFPMIKKAGWHFSYLGGISKILEKNKSIVDGTIYFNSKKMKQERNKFKNDDEYIKYMITHGKNVTSKRKSLNKFKIVDINEIGIENINNIYNEFPDLFYQNFNK